MALAGLKLGLGPRVRNEQWPRLATIIGGVEIPNAIGLAAGFDKNAEVPDAMLDAGFGFVECGTVTPKPQPGNPRPRVFRLTEDQGAINRLGFNNEGLDAFVAGLEKRGSRRGVVGANVGANKDSTDRVADYVLGLQRVWQHVSYVTVNISSPNTPGLRGLQEKGALEDLLGRLREARAPLVTNHGIRPIFLKVAPDLDETAVRDIAETVRAFAIDGLIVSNTTLSRPSALRSRYRGEAGGLSGKPLFELSTIMLKLFAEALGGAMPLIGAGGVDSGAAALAKIKAGASAVQLYTGMVFQGPSLAARIAQELSDLLASEGFSSLREAVGVAISKP